MSGADPHYPYVSFSLGRPEHELCWHFLVYPNNAIGDVRYSEMNGGYAWSEPDTTWNASDLEMASRINGGTWTLELALPWRDLGIAKPDGRVFSFQLTCPSGKHGMAWAPGAGYGLPVTSGLIVLGAAPTDPAELARVRHAAVEPTLEGGYLHELSSAVVTPHTDWCKPDARGRAKVLFLGTRDFKLTARFMVEMAERADIDYVPYLALSDANERDFWEHNIIGSSTEAKARELAEKLKGDYDAIIMRELKPEWLDDAARDALRAKVEAGAGLLVLDGASPWPGQPADGAPAIARGIPLALLPAYHAGTLEQWQSAVTDAVQTTTLGKGRIACVKVGGYGMRPEDETYLDYHVALALNALAWVRPALPAPLQWLELPDGVSLYRAPQQQALPVRVHADGDTPRTLEMRVTVRTPLQTLDSRSSRITLQPGDNTLPISLPSLPRGAYFRRCAPCLGQGRRAGGRLRAAHARGVRARQPHADARFPAGKGERD